MSRFSLPRYPLIQAPMAGGITTVELVAAVANAGAVGSFGFAYSTPDVIAADLAQCRTQTDGAVLANVFVIDEPAPPSQIDREAACAALEALAFPGVVYSEPEPPHIADVTAQLAPIWAQPPTYLTFHFGVPSQDIIARAQACGIAVGISATSPSEAKESEAAGADFIIAQGIEAGGHRGTFEAAPRVDEALSTLTLTKRLNDNTSLPIVAAGGIMTATHIKEALAAGAVAVQMGTAFLAADEAGTPSSYREALCEVPCRETILTTQFSGRVARSLQNEFTTKMAGQAILPFPIQNRLTGPLRSAAVKSGTAEYQSLWAGTGVADIVQGPAAKIVAQLCTDL